MVTEVPNDTKKYRAEFKMNVQLTYHSKLQLQLQ